MNSEIAKLTSMRKDELFEAAKQLQVPYELVEYVHCLLYTSKAIADS